MNTSVGQASILARVIRAFAADELIKEGFNAVTLDGGYGSWNRS